MVRAATPERPAAAITASAGFSVGVAKAGIKSARDRLDVALIVADRPAVCAGVFTQNLVQAAPVRWSRAIVARRKPVRAILVNSGNANACTGKAGEVAVRESARAVARTLGCRVTEVLVASTGVIGVPLPTAKLVAAIPTAAAARGASAEHGHAGARAIMTTDTRPKESVATFTYAGRVYIVAGMAKGAGMIHPNMATMLGFLTTDAALAPAQAQRLLASAAACTFNAVSIDGDTSTNDSLFLLASGAAGGVIPPRSAAEARLARALYEVCAALAQAIAADGEGAQKLLVVRVAGAKTDAQACRVARTIVSSPLVKTAVHGGDPNWGRVLAAAGRAEVPFNPSRAELRIGGHVVCKSGAAYAAGEADAASHLQGSRIEMELRLGSGKGRAVAYGCDLSAGYVAENAHYRT